MVACVIGLFFIAGTARAATPSVVIRSPNNGLRTTNANITIQGTAFSRDTNDPIASVTVFVNGVSQTADGTTNWQANVTLSPGSNNIEAQATTVNNNQSANTSRTITLLVYSTLTVSTNGNGRVSPNLNGTTQLLGQALRMTAIAANDWIFTGWTGSTNSTNTSLSFTMTDGANLTANFEPHPLHNVRGVYNGLIFNTNNINGNSSGSFNLIVNKPNTYTLRINIGNSSGTATGTFDDSGAADFSTRGRNPITGHMQLDLSGQSDQVVGDVTSPTTASMLGDRDIFDARTNLCPFAGQYNMIIQPNDVVQGQGYATVFVDSSGNLRMNGVLADGKTISQSTTIAKDGSWPMSAAPYGANNGAFMGWITITNIPQSSLHGVSYWFHPAMRSGAFKDEFSQRQDVIGSLFIQPPPHVPIMVWQNGIGTVGGDDLSTTISSSLTWNSNNVISVALNDFTFQVTSFGKIRGTLTVPGSHRRDLLQGVILPKTNWAGGFFLDTNASGFFSINEDLTAGTNTLVQAPGDISSFDGHPAVLTLSLDKKSGFLSGFNTMTFDIGQTGTTTVTSSDVADFGTANYNYSSYVSTSANIAELNIVGGTVRGHTVVIRMLLHYTDAAGQQGDFIATITAGGSGTATGTFTLP